MQERVPASSQQPDDTSRLDLAADSGLVGLVTILAYYDIAASPEKLRREHCVAGQVMSSFELVTAARASGLKAAMSQARYRNLSILDMAPLFLEPLKQNKIAIASPATPDGKPTPDGISAIAVWASVSPDVDTKIREQIDAGTYPIRLQPGDWSSGDTHWLIDIIAPSERLTTAVIANFRQVLKEGDLCIHPMVAGRLDPEVLEKLGARRMTPETAA